MASTNYDRVLKEITPLIKASAARMMVNEYKLKQQRIAQLLGITQAAVSKYVNSDAKNAGRKLDSNVVKGFVDGLLHGDKLGAQRYKCMLCQAYETFDCSLIVK